MILRTELASGYCWLLLSIIICFQHGNAQNVVINYPHFPVFGHNYFQSWNVTNGYGSTFVYPGHSNASVFDQYQFFVNDINFDTNTPGNLFIGAKDVLYEMNANLSVVREYRWPVSSASASECSSISIDTSYACHNHIRVYTRLPQSNANDRLWVCGTDAYNPVCKTLDINNIQNPSGQSDTNVSTNNVGMLSVHPALPALWGFQGDSQLLASGFYRANEWNNYDFARYNIAYNTTTRHLEINHTHPDRTIQSSDDYHIREPYYPISMYDVRLSPENDASGMYLFFFREREFTAQDSSAAPVRSRVIRICKNDQATSSSFFGSLLKAEIFCAKRPLGTPEAFGAQTFYYTGLRDTHYGYNNSRWYGNRNVWDRLLYGAFTSEQYAPNGTAICVYYAGIKNFAVVSDFLDGDHRGVLEVFNQNHFLSKSGTRQANSFLNCDHANARSEVDLFLAESGIQQYKGLYLPLLELPGEVVTKIAVDEVCVVLFNDTDKCMMQDVLFVGTNVGKIYKIVFTTKVSDYPSMNRLGLDGVTHDPVIAQEWQLADSNSVERLYLRKDNGKRYIYATTFSRVYKFDAYNCQRHGSCRDCVASRDPYCYWNTNSNMCEFLDNLVDISNSGEVSVPTGYLQNVHTGYSSSCNEPSYCNIAVTPHYPGGFMVTNDCQGTATRQVTITSHGCPSNPLSSPVMINGDTQVIDDSNILGLHLYRVNFTATYTSNPPTSEIFFVTTVGGAPTVLTSNEVYASGQSNGFVQVTVNIDGCSLHSTPNDHTIFVSFRGVNGSYINSSQPYNGGNTFIAGSYYSCENVTYTVSVTNSYGTSPVYSGIIQPYTGPPGRPNTVSVSGITSDSATIRWTQPNVGVDNNYCNVITGYSVYVGNVKKRDCVVDTMFTIHGLVPNTNYLFGVSACSEGGESALREIPVTTRCERPSRVRDLTATALSYQSVSFNWNRPVAVNGTDLQYILMEECYNQTMLMYDDSNYTTTDTSHIVSSLPPLSLCCLTVTAIATCQLETYTSIPHIACVRTPSSTPGPIENFNIMPTSPTTMYLTWTPPMNFTYAGMVYEIDVIDPQGMTLQYETSQLYYYITEDIFNDTEYRFCVVVRNEIASSSQVCLNATTLPSPPEAPTDVSLMFMGCTLIVTWQDSTWDRYSVDTYNVSVRCNNDIRSMTVPVPTMNATFNYCSGSDLSSIALSWCSARVYSENDVGPSGLSDVVDIVTADNISTPQCYLTENIGHAVTISFTLTAPYALDTLRVKYSLADVGGTMEPVEIPFNGSNILTFSNVVRKRSYDFTLRLCDSNMCSQSCVQNFTANAINPHPPVDLRATVLFNIINIVWSRPPNDSSTFIYTVQVTGANSDNNTRRTNDTSIVWTGLDPESQYSISVMATDVASNISSVFSNSIIVNTDSGTGIPSAVNAIYYRNTNENRLNAFWDSPTVWNGTILSYTIMWSTNITACGSIVSTQHMQVNNSIRSIDVTNPTGLSENTQNFLICVAAETLAGRGDWKHTIITKDGIIITGGLSGGNTPSDNLALALVTVVALLAILAAVAIMIIFGITYYMRNRKMRDDGTPPPLNVNGSSKRGVLFKGKRKAVRTPERDNTQSIRSTAPMITDVHEC